MGVKGLWTLLQPIARNVRLEDMDGLVVAVDASIWLYHFMKAMRDPKTGEMMRNAHIVGFFRRICKLLFYNLRPVFVFDGTVPELKRQTIRGRRDRKQASSAYSEATRDRLIAAKLKRYALEQVSGAPTFPAQKGKVSSTEAVDEYQLPVVHVPPPASLTTSNINSLLWEDIGLGEVSHLKDSELESIESDTAFFHSLPRDIQQEILRELRIRSRQTSWERLDHMVSASNTALDFSRHQITNLVRRNEIWQKWDDSSRNAVSDIVSGKVSQVRRVAAEPDREYMLIKNADNATWSIKASSASVAEDPSVMPETGMQAREGTEVFAISHTRDMPLVHASVDDIISTSDKIVAGDVDISDSDDSIVFPAGPTRRIGPLPIVVDAEDDDISDTVPDEPAVDSITAGSPKSPQDEGRTVATSPQISKEVVQINADEDRIYIDTEAVELAQPPELPIAKNVETDAALDEQRDIENLDRTDIGDEAPHENDDYADFVAKVLNRGRDEVDVYLEQEIAALHAEHHTQKRDASSLTSDMIADAKVLLSLFGIPVVVAPMEAEAQCAYLKSNGLVDGIITDDSDIFLFGGDQVYRNLFSQTRFVERYDFADIEKQMCLTRNRLVNLAYLLGSDYCNGMPGVGPVTAMEIIAEFQDDGLESLVKFAQWTSDVVENKSEYTPFTHKFGSNAVKWLVDGFPDPRARNEYLNPNVDAIKSKFEWQVPNLNGIRKFMFDKVGWEGRKVDDMLFPVIRNVSSKLKQTKMEAFVTVRSVAEPIFRPKILDAITRLKGRDAKPSQIDAKPVAQRSSSTESDSDHEKKKLRKRKQPARKTRARKKPALKSIKELYA
eukprot:Partr_v1_DN27439_c0_g1_i6_m71808 putative Excision repair cross-complementing rodent repair deficiency, complementation group 5